MCVCVCVRESVKGCVFRLILGVQDQGGGKILDVDGAGLGGLEN